MYISGCREAKERLNIRMSGVEFSAKELKELVVSCVRVQRRVRHIPLLPKYLSDTKSAINAALNSFQNKLNVK